MSIIYSKFNKLINIAAAILIRVAARSAATRFLGVVATFLDLPQPLGA
ncbi:MAG: hypothetical protein NW214_13680 [Pseudanabaenaceae cyanobacterium bins.39]|nr:hypothetical protein [Pseudanabaenaceae cyanobacterium bins.39]